MFAKMFAPCFNCRDQPELLPPCPSCQGPSLRQCAHLSGEQLWVKIDSTLRFLGQPPVDDPPAPVVFGSNPVGSLLIDYDTSSEIRLRLSVGPLSEDIMVFGQQPCSSGR